MPKSKVGRKNIVPDKELFRYWCRRWGYIPMEEEIASLVGVSPKYIYEKMYKRGVADKEKIAIAKEFELTAQEFVDLFYPNYFHKNGHIKLDREVKYKDVYEKRFDVFPWVD